MLTNRGLNYVYLYVVFCTLGMDCKSKNSSNKKLVQGKLLYMDTNVVM